MYSNENVPLASYGDNNDEDDDRNCENFLFFFNEKF